MGLAFGVVRPYRWEQRVHQRYTFGVNGNKSDPAIMMTMQFVFLTSVTLKNRSWSYSTPQIEVLC